MRLRHLVPAPVLLLAAGCISTTTLIKVKPDGSGTIVQTVTMRTEMAGMMRDMRRGFAQERSDRAPAVQGLELFPRSEAVARAADLGQDVTFVSHEPIKTRDAEGMKATYAFKDVEGLRIVQEPSPPSAPGAPVPEPGSMGGSTEPLTFRFERRPDGRSVVTAIFPPARGVVEREASWGGGGRLQSGSSGPSATQERILKGLRISVVLEVEGKLVRTDSPYVEGASVTLTDVDFDRLLADEARLGQLAGIYDLETAKTVLKDVKGMKVHLDPVTVEFVGK